MTSISYEGMEFEYFTLAKRYSDQKRPERRRATGIPAKSFNQPERGLEINSGILHLFMVDERRPHCKNISIQPEDLVSTWQVLDS
jgi:hypothetical protein